MKQKIIRIILFILLFIAMFALSFGITTVIVKTKAEPSIKDFEYAIIYYPDMKTSVEGYIDNYVYAGGNLINVTLDGATYVTSSENVIIIKNKSLTLNKEATDDNREDTNN